MAKENFLKRFFNKIKNGWKRLGEPDIEIDNEKDPKLAKKVAELKEVQKKVREGFVERIGTRGNKKVDPLIERFGEAEPGNPIFDQAKKISKDEKPGEEHML